MGVDGHFNNIKGSTKINGNVEFIQKLENSVKYKDMPSRVSKDVKHTLILQKERLNHLGLKYRSTYEERDGGKYAYTGSFDNRATRQDSMYTSRMEYVAVDSNREISRDGKGLYRIHRKEFAYITTTSLKYGVEKGNVAISCPSCGNISTAAQLELGCSYCNSSFVMTELFPRVTDVMFLPDYVDARNSKSSIIKWMSIPAFICALPMILLCIYTQIVTNKLDIFGYTLAICLGAGFGAFLGMVIWSLKSISVVSAAAVRTATPLVHQKKSKEMLNQFAQNAMPEFSYDYFINEMVAKLKLLIYTKNRNDLTIIKSNRDMSSLDRVVYSVHSNDVEVKRADVEGEYCTIDLRLGMIDYYYDGNGIYSKEDHFNLQVYKRKNSVNFLNFSIKRVVCSSCGGSFDATYIVHCPNCGSVYDLSANQWMIRDCWIE